MAEANEQRQRFGYTDESGNRVSALRDMFNGGGRGQAGDRFEGGGVLSAIGNAFGGPSDGGGMNMGRAAGSMMGGMAFGPIGGLLGGMIGRNMSRSGFGYTDAMGNVVSPQMDMFDGGGRGMAGDTFQGGLLSGILNAMGVRPRGFEARQDAMVAAPDPTAPSLMAAPARISVGASPRPSMRSSGPGPMVPNYVPAQPGMNVMPDGEAFLRQNLAVIPALTGPSMTMPRTDVGTIRPYVSRSTGRIPPMMDFPPLRGVTNPPPLLLPR